MKFQLIITFCIIITPYTNACINSRGYSMREFVSKKSIAEIKHITRLQKIIKQKPKQGFDVFRQNQIKSGRYDANNIEGRAIEYLMTGKVHKGITILLKIEQLTPGIYSTAANLGTAYDSLVIIITL